jgi:hypothetical protein
MVVQREYIPADTVADSATEEAEEGPTTHASLIGATPLEWAKSVLALVGLVALALQGLRWIGPKPAED